jgi:hypothetical protein
MNINKIGKLILVKFCIPVHEILQVNIIVGSVETIIDEHLPF